MSDQSDRLLSDDTFQAVRNVLVAGESLNREQIESVIRQIERACWLALTIDLPESPRAVRDELEALYDSLEMLFAAIRGMSHHSYMALWKTARFDSEDDDLANYGGSRGTADEFLKLARPANLIARALQLTLEELEVPKGSPPKVEARHLAFNILVALDQHGISTTSYDDGTYFQILHHVFKDVLPEDDYTRAARWALKDGHLEETFFKPISARNSSELE